jgi:hypothetical protein
VIVRTFGTFVRGGALTERACFFRRGICRTLMRSLDCGVFGAGGQQQIELDQVWARRLTRRQVGDDLAERLGAILDLGQRLVERRELELHAHQEQLEPLLHADEQAMLLVLREHCQERLIDLEVLEIRGLRRRRRGELLQPLEDFLDAAHLLRVVGGQDLPVDVDGGEQQIEHRVRELLTAEAQIVEHIFQPMRQLAHVLVAE